MSDDSASGADTFTTTTTVSWIDRLKAAIGGVVTGLALVVGSCFLLFWNEGRAVQTARSLAEGGAAVVSVDAGKVDPANDGKLIHVSGPVKTASPIVDQDFGVSTNAIRLVRVVEMYQWTEEKRTETRKTLGGSEETVTVYTYRRKWAGGREDSSRFNQPGGHHNPDLRYRATDTANPSATVGAFRMSDAVVKQISARDPLPVGPDVSAQLRGRVQGPVQVVDGVIYLGSNPSDPRIGDHRISYRVAQPETVSVIGRQSGSGFEAYQTQAGDRLLMATAGNVPAKDMFRAAEQANTVLTWILRAVGAFLMFVGFGLVLRPLVVVGDFVPLIGSMLGAGAGLVSLVLTAVLATIIIAIAWFYYRPLVAVGVLVVGGAIAFGLRTLASRRAAARAGLPAPAG